ncbi:MAG: copper amine oxidase N-terminal domain-containing protein [Clostridiales bacterium]|nr:copper amine oxidase N-terminal domain-containing protein [Clostridiales bacterium]
MKKWLIVVLLLIVINVSYGEGINIIIDSEEVIFTEAYGIPFIDENSRTQIPLRTALEHFGAEVGWIPERSVATVSYGDKIIEVPIGEAYIFVNGEKVYNDTVALIKNGRTFLPLRVVFESLGAEVLWESETRSVVVNSPVAYMYGSEIGQLATNIEATDQFDKVVSLEGLKGKNILLSYYSTW